MRGAAPFDPREVRFYVRRDCRRLNEPVLSPPDLVPPLPSPPARELDRIASETKWGETISMTGPLSVLWYISVNSSVAVVFIEQLENRPRSSHERTMTPYVCPRVGEPSS